MVLLRSLGYGKKSIENKIIEEAEHLVEAFRVILEHVHGLSFNSIILSRICQ